MIPGASLSAQPFQPPASQTVCLTRFLGPLESVARVRLLQYHALMRALSPAGSSRSIASTAQHQPNLSHVASTNLPEKASDGQGSWETF